MSAAAVVALAAGAGAALGALGWALVQRVWRPRRWQCQGCGHPYSAHVTGAGQPRGCAVGIGLCGCQVYVGRTPPARLLGAVAAFQRDAERDGAAAATPG